MTFQIMFLPSVLRQERLFVNLFSTLLGFILSSAQKYSKLSLLLALQMTFL